MCKSYRSIDVATRADSPMKTTTTKGTLNLCFSHLKLQPPFETFVHPPTFRKITTMTISELPYFLNRKLVHI